MYLSGGLKQQHFLRTVQKLSENLLSAVVVCLTLPNKPRIRTPKHKIMKCRNIQNLNFRKLWISETSELWIESVGILYTIFSEIPESWSPYCLCFINKTFRRFRTVESFCVCATSKIFRNVKYMVYLVCVLQTKLSGFMDLGENLCVSYTQIIWIFLFFLWTFCLCFTNRIIGMSGFGWKFVYVLATNHLDFLDFCGSFVCVLQTRNQEI